MLFVSRKQELRADEVTDYTQTSVDQVFKDKPFDALLDVVGGKAITPRMLDAHFVSQSSLINLLAGSMTLVV